MKPSPPAGERARAICCRRLVARIAPAFLASTWLHPAHVFAQTGGGPATSPGIADIEPPFDVLPYPTWMLALLAAVALLLLALAAWLIVRWLRRRPAPPPAMPGEIALAALREAEKQLDVLDPYRFSILVSDILRRYVTAQFGLHATEQTSPEFLAAVSRFPQFKPEEKSLLAAFLERCDLIKFARIDATRDDSRTLLGQARDFVSHASRRNANANASTSTSARVPPPMPGAAAATAAPASADARGTAAPAAPAAAGTAGGGSARP